MIALTLRALSIGAQKHHMKPLVGPRNENFEATKIFPLLENVSLRSSDNRELRRLEPTQHPRFVPLPSTR